eukprot:3224844-Rhodomonas_salina.9
MPDTSTTLASVRSGSTLRASPAMAGLFGAAAASFAFREPRHPPSSGSVETSTRTCDGSTTGSLLPRYARSVPDIA